jgi:hypothetical protein
MFATRKIQLLGMAVLIAAATLVTISAIRVPAPADLSWPSRPDFSVLNQKVFVSGNQAASDYYERHAELNERAVINAELSDYSLRHPELSERAGIGADMSDYSLRHPDLIQKTNSIDTSDYFQRH